MNIIADILRDKTMADKFIYIPNDDTPFVDYNTKHLDTQLNKLTN